MRIKLSGVMGATMAAISSAYLTQDHGLIIGAVVGGLIGAFVAVFVGFFVRDAR